VTTRRARWTGGVLLTLAVAYAVTYVVLRPKRAPPVDPRVAWRAEAYHYCELRLVASLPTAAKLNVRALNRGKRSSTEIGTDTFRVVGFFEGEIFGYQSHGEYQCLVRHSGAKDYELMQLRLRRYLPDPHK
jgi:hypothetical protein